MRIPIKATVSPTKAVSSSTKQANPLAGGAAAANTFMGNISTLLSDAVSKQDKEKADLLNVETESVKIDFEDNLRNFNSDFLQKIASGEIPEEQVDQSYREATNQIFDKTIENRALPFASKVDKSKFELDAYKVARSNFANNIFKQLPTIDLAKKQQALTGLTTRLSSSASDPSANLDQLKQQLRAPSVSNVMNQVYGDGALLERSKAIASITTSYYNGQADSLSEQGDIAGLTVLSTELQSNKDLPDEQKQMTLGRLASLTDKTVGTNLASDYLVDHFDKNNPYDEQAANRYIEQNKQVTAEQKQAFLNSYKLKAKQLEAVQKVTVDNAKLQYMDTLDLSKIPAAQWQQLPDKAKQEIQTYHPAERTDSDKFNNQLYQIMQGDQVDVLSAENSQHITPNDLKELYQRQQRLSVDPAQKKQASVLSVLIKEAFKARNINNKTQQLSQFALVMDELDGQQRVKQAPLTAGDIQDAIKRVLPTDKKLTQPR